MRPPQKARLTTASKWINATRINTGAAFDFYAKLMTMKSFSDVVELATAHARTRLHQQAIAA